MDTEILTYYNQVLQEFLLELRREMNNTPLDHPDFPTLEEMNIHTLFFLSICKKLMSLPEKEQQSLFNDIYSELEQFTKVIQSVS